MSLVSAITEIKQRIRALETELARLHSELEAARKALETGQRRPRARKPSRLNPPALATEPYKENSSVARAVDVLREADRDLHIDTLLEKVNERGPKVGKSTLVGNLSRYVREGHVFTRHSRSHYGLAAWQLRDIEELIGREEERKTG